VSAIVLLIAAVVVVAGIASQDKLFGYHRRRCCNSFPFYFLVFLNIFCFM